MNDEAVLSTLSRAPAIAATLALALALALPASAAAQGRQARPAPDISVASTGTSWNQLSAEQRAALRPLRAQWSKLGAEDQRQWLATTRNFSRLAPDEQALLQQRMSDWARLSPTERTRARLNFGEVRRVPRDERRERWEQYQELSAEERARLARERRDPPPGAAPALRPAPPGQILRPAPRRGGSDEASGATPRRSPVNRNTLLPRPPERERP